MGKHKKQTLHLNNSAPRGEHARVRAQLLQIQQYLDLLTGEVIPRFRDGSYHHLIKDEYGGDYTVDNGAMLLWLTHQYIHNVIELNDPTLFNLVTECLMLYKECILQNHTELIEQFQQNVQPKARQLVKTYNHKKR